MKILLCSEFYSPSIGGVQIVMQQIAERFAAEGHEVIVATTALKERVAKVINGVHIVEFDIRGNLVNGLSGEIGKYKEFIKGFDGDVILIKAAQQWTFDSIWDELRQIKARKVFVPCGFSCLYEKSYSTYYKHLPEILKVFDHLIFYSGDYRDIDFVKKHGLLNYSILSNGADEREFNVSIDPDFRSKLDIDPEAFLMLNVASLSELKGQSELIDAFELVPSHGKKLHLLLNCNVALPKNRIQNQKSNLRYLPGISQQWMDRIWKFQLLCSPDNVFEVLKAFRNPFKIFRRLSHVNKKLNSELIEHRPPPKVPPKESLHASILRRAELINCNQDSKKVLLIDLPRDQLIQAYMSADLFVFPSHLEYSPLVLFESAAAGTPFLSSEAGNAAELTKWFHGGFVFNSPKNSEGICSVEPQVLADEMSLLINQSDHLQAMGTAMKMIWAEKYTWGRIFEYYKNILFYSESKSRLKKYQDFA